MNQKYNAGWTAMENATQADFEAVIDFEAEYNAALVDRLLLQLKQLDEPWTPYPLNRYQHSLQSATRALNDGADEETIVAALLHDIGDVTAPYNHGEVAAAILKPYVSEKTYWVVKHHCVFQGYYYNHYLGGDRNARERYKDSPYYEDCKYFCHHYDQNAFDPEYASKPLEFFIPMMRRLFGKNEGHMELAERADDKVS
ncbi:MAG: HD domain-containing protein [Gammaproteobacteria bacterium]|nr:HD domain-containing protein [Gammaproteobacteria bacterium]